MRRVWVAFGIYAVGNTAALAALWYDRPWLSLTGICATPLLVCSVLYARRRP
jgi:hypothetical protein